MSEESIMKEMLYWKNKAGELALRVLELEGYLAPNSPQSRGDDGSLVTSKASISCEEPSCKPKTLVDTNNKEEYYGHKKEVMKDYDN